VTAALSKTQYDLNLNDMNKKQGEVFRIKLLAISNSRNLYKA